jgi:hypothetical protein
MNEAPTLSQVFEVGCLCQIEKHIELPDGSTIIDEVSTFKILDVLILNNLFT